MGAFWYFFSTQRLAACWHKACEIHGVEISFNCDHGFRKLSFLDDFCPIDTPNPSTFDFGIFLEARRSGSLESTNYLPKAFYCFWWHYKQHDLFWPFFFQGFLKFVQINTKTGLLLDLLNTFKIINTTLEINI